MKIQREASISPEKFLENYLIPNQPVIITDGMSEWDIERFSPNSLNQHFGNHEVQIYDQLFDLQTVDTLESYLKSNFNKAEGEPASQEYIRWYTKLRDVDFFWSDDVFNGLQTAWTNPYFLPTHSFIIPWNRDKALKANEARFPYKGLFISGKGARTRLHRDPFNSVAILCQFYGTKSIKLYSPDQENLLMTKDEFVDIEIPDRQKFPRFSEAKCTYEDILQPGEIVMFPSGWFHDVTCLTDSISVTWNFVHSSHLNTFYEYIKNNPNDSQLEIVRFFLKGYIGENAGVQEITSYLQQTLSQSNETII